MDSRSHAIVRLCLPTALVGAAMWISLAGNPPRLESGRARLDSAYGNLPLSFEPNLGQSDAQVRFLARGRGYVLFLTLEGAVLAARGKPGAAVGMKLVGANLESEAAGLDPLPGRSNYFLGNDPSRWPTDVPHFARVRQYAVYPGVDLIYHGAGGQLEFDFVVAPGADPGCIRLAFEGVDRMRLDPNGDLALETGAAELRQHRPVVYQERGAHRHYLEGRYVLHGTHLVGFEVAPYDHGWPLVIDPALSYSTYVGGSGDEASSQLAIDSAGNAYVVGETDSLNFPTAGSLRGTLMGPSDAFVIKLNAAGSALVYAIYLGGNAEDVATAIAVDSAGNAYVTGATRSYNFPVVNPFRDRLSSGDDAFVAKINPAGNALVYSTYLGGLGRDWGTGIAVDAGGSAYLSGHTTSDVLVATTRSFQWLRKGKTDAFVTRLSPSGAALIYSTYIGGAEYDDATDVVIDAEGNAYVTGSTESSDFPTVNPLQSSRKGTVDAFVAKLNPSGSTLVYSTYLGGSNRDYGVAIALDSSGSAYVTGSSYSPDFPTVNALQPSHKGLCDAFVAKLNARGSALLYSTYLGGTQMEEGEDIALDSRGNALVTGWTEWTDFPSVRALQPRRAGERDAFLAKLDASGSFLLFSTYLGGTRDDWGYGIAVDATGNAYVTGATRSPDFGMTPGAFQTKYGGDRSGGAWVGDAFVVKITGLTDTTPVVSILSAASFKGDALAPDSFASAFGSKLATVTALAQETPLPSSLGGTTVTVTDSGGAERPAPLFSVAPGQVNFIVPKEAKTGRAKIKVTASDGSVSTGEMQVDTVAPGLFSANADGTGVAAAYVTRYGAGGTQSTELVFEVHAATGKLVAKPVDLGPPTDQLVLVLFGTGFRFRSGLAAVKVTIGGQECEVLYAGAQGEFAGLDQVNVRLPRGLHGRDDADIVMTVDGKRANVVMVNFAGRPRVGSLSPATARAGETVGEFTITGTYLGEVTLVQFSPSAGITVSNLRVSETRITAQLVIAPDAAVGERSVSVVAPSGSSATVPFLVRPRPGPAPFIFKVAISSDSGMVWGSFEYEDADGDIFYTGSLQGSAALNYRILTVCTIRFSGPFLDQRGQTSGKVTFFYRYPTTGSPSVGTGPSNKFWLTDAAGNSSNIHDTGQTGGVCP